MTVSIDNSLLLSYYNSRAGGTTASGGSSAPSVRYAPSAPWLPGKQQTPSNTPALMTAAVKKAMEGQKLVDETSAQLDLAGASLDYKKLFALYQGLDTLSGVANQMGTKNLSSLDKERIKTVFAKGLAEVTAYADTVKLDQVRLIRGAALDKAVLGVGAPKTQADYVTPALVSGDITAPVDALSGDVRFNISVKRVGITYAIPIDLADMGATPRTLGAVANFINDQLVAAGVGTRVATQRIPGGDRTVTVGGKPVKVGTTPDSWALKVKVDSGDTVTFSAADTAPTLYLAQQVGNPDPDGKPSTNDGVTRSQLLKVQTETGLVPAPSLPPGQSTQVDGQVWAKDLETTIRSVRATQVAPDGSVYVLADVNGAVSGQAIKGAQDVALLKYDSAGKLIFTRTLGASADASGLAMAVNTDGQVAIAGKVTGGLGGALEGALNSGDSGSFAANSDSFVTLLNKDGEEQWTERRGVRLQDEATHLAFGADGAVYVAGRSQSALPGSTALGGWDNYIEGFKADSTGKVSTLFAQNVGGAGADRPGGLVVDGSSLVLAGNEDGRGVIRRFDLSGAAPVQTATRDLGDLQGGDITGLALVGSTLVVAGATANAALNAGTVTRALTGGKDGFVAQLASDLTPGAGDSLAYYGGAGDERVTGLAVAAGKVYLTGQAGTDLPGHPDAVGKVDGFLAELDVAAGAVDWSRRFSGAGGRAIPTALAVDAGGASALDRLGLPKGALDMSDSTQISAFTSIRPGDEFQVRAGASGARKTVTFSAGETLETLQAKLRRALNFQAKVDIITVSGTRRLQIKPQNDRELIEISAGKTDKSALGILGLTEGVVRATRLEDGKSIPADGKGQIYGLSLAKDLKVDTKDNLAHTVSELAQAMGVIRSAYKDLKAAATPKSVQDAAKAATGPVPAYLTNQIANYQQALARLTGGG